jgi:hypothetical protein
MTPPRFIPYEINQQLRENRWSKSLTMTAARAEGREIPN